MTAITPTPIVARNRSICQSTTGDDNARSLHPSTAPHGRQPDCDQAALDLGQGFNRPISLASRRHHASPRLPATSSMPTKSP
jgi:hypothetical protein